jgi:hypothetical protein
MRAPLINDVDISFASKNSLLNEKGHQQALSAPLMALETLVPLASDGAGYDDYEQNNAYRNTDGAGENEADQPTCEGVAHWGNLRRVYRTSFSNASGTSYKFRLSADEGGQLLTGGGRPR